MSVINKIQAGYYALAFPFKDAPVTVGDFSGAQIARIEVYPEGYDPFAEDKQGQPKIVRLKPTYQFCLDTVTTDRGVVRQVIQMTDRKLAEELLAQELARIHSQFYQDLCDDQRKGSTWAIPNKQTEKLFGLVMQLRHKGLTAVANEWARLFPILN